MSATAAPAERRRGRVRRSSRPGRSGVATCRSAGVARQALLPLAFVSLAAPAAAQRASDNAVTAAEDAFGTSIGNETIGLYGPGQVRGFSPVAAGNVRIEGVYIDRQGAIPQRLVSGSTIRVGLSAQGYLFPAPTGIVDYRLRGIGDRPLVSVVAGRFAYGAPAIEVDAQLPLIGRSLGIAVGASWAHEEYYDGSDAHYLRAALIPRWRPRDGIEVIPFYAITLGRGEQVAPTVLAAGNAVPPDAPRRRYFGQQWAQKDTRSINTGAIAKVRFGADWSVTAGGFRSIFVNERNFAELFTGTTANGTTTERIVADPGQRYASTSGELRLGRSLTEGPRLHMLYAAIRARALDSFYGGAAPALDLGPRQLGVPVPVPQPQNLRFGARAHDRVRQTTVGLAYEGRWKGVGEAGIGLQRTGYRKTIDQPSLPRTGTTDRPWLLNANVAAYLTERLAAYASYTRGLEESGIAPVNAANRNEALPAIRTRQVDGGVRWALPGGMKLVAGVFDVAKPYFNTDERNVFAILGDVRHRGVEISLAGNPTERLSLIAGAVLMRPRVTGVAVDDGRVGSRPLNQPARTIRANAEYRPAFAPGFSVDLAVANIGRRYASRDNVVTLPSYALVDLGARYRFRIGKAPATFRVQMQNIGDTFAWNIVGSNSYGLMDKRRITAFLVADF